MQALYKLILVHALREHVMWTQQSHYKQDFIMHVWQVLVKAKAKQEEEEAGATGAEESG